MMAHFPVSAKKVQELLPSSKLKPIQLKPDIAVVTLSAMQHRHIDQLEPYNEAAILFPVIYESNINVSTEYSPFSNETKRFDLYFHYLPVTTQEACNVGIDIYGFPKFVADISFEDVSENCHCKLSAEGKDIFSLEVKKLMADEQFINFFCYTVKDGQLLKTFVPTQGQFGTSESNEDVSFTLGNHAIANELKSLEISDTAVEYLYASKVQGLLFPPGEFLPL